MNDHWQIASESELYRTHQLHQHTQAEIDEALRADKTASRILDKGIQIVAGQLVGIRINLNIWKARRVAVHTVHHATNAAAYRSGSGFYRGTVIGYLPAVLVRDAFFNVNAKSREEIAAGEVSKHPMASIDGTYINGEIVDCCEGVEVMFCPKREHLFVDSEGYAVRWAEEATILGHRAYCRGKIAYFTDASAPQKGGDAPSLVRFKKLSKNGDLFD
jgi:hypothetical protein